ncbi:MAG: WD40/YVTN/BNR-like repeat-containing protein, partial [Candidatus Binatia bacterium]
MAPPPRREERAAPVAAGPVIIASRSNRDVLWRIAGSEIERSEDGGKTWVSRPAGTAAVLTAASSPAPENCWVVGRGGTILRTTDGEAWEKIASPTDEDLVQVTAYGPFEATVGSASGRRFATHDGGKTWSER